MTAEDLQDALDAMNEADAKAYRALKDAVAEVRETLERIQASIRGGKTMTDYTPGVRVCRNGARIDSTNTCVSCGAGPRHNQKSGEGQ
jgi:transcription elongation GreA/GreB family factor